MMARAPKSVFHFLTRPLPMAAAALTFSLAATSAQAQDGFEIEMLEVEVTDVDQKKYDDARTLLAEESYAEALAAYDEILADKKYKDMHAASQYDSAKALYRLRAYHASLDRFAEILEAGPSHAFYEKTREWLFFIARRTADERAALSLIATYTKQKDVPEEYADEFNYQLARFHFLNALSQGATGVAEEEEEEEGLEFDAIEVGEEGGDAPDEEDDGGFDFSDVELGGGDDDGFDFSFDDVETDKKKKKKRKKRRGRKKRSSKKAKDSSADAKAKADVSDEKTKKSAKKKRKKKRKAHKNKNPKTAEASLKLALEHIGRVSEGYAQFAKATYLRGLIHFTLGNFEPSVEAFRGVVRQTAEGEAFENAKLREMAFFSLARIHYQFDQFRYAIFYYERIDRDSEAWLDALFETSWANFRLGEYEKALGNLITIQSPFFENEYYPETHILKAITFFENCRYPEAKTFLDEYDRQYGAVMKELERIIGETQKPEDLYAQLSTLEEQLKSNAGDDARSTEITAQLVRLALSDKRISAYRAAIVETEAETEILKDVGPPWTGMPSATQAIEKVAERKQVLIKDAGGLLQSKLQSELQFLKSLASKLIRIQFEIAKQEKESLEAQMRSERQTVPISDYVFTTATDDERVYWPFEGEYWRDELGTYQYTLTRGCRPPEDEG